MYRVPIQTLMELDAENMQDSIHVTNYASHRVKRPFGNTSHAAYSFIFFWIKFPQCGTKAKFQD